MKQNYCYQCCLADICKHIDRGTHTLASPACDAFDPGMRWIPVTERLPKPLEEVLILTQKAIGKSHVSLGQYSRLTGMWYIEEYSTQAKITHWMPLPDAPADEKEE